MKNTKKPFGLEISIKVALSAIKSNIAPSSVILNNLFYLQKSSIFPKNLDPSFFTTIKANVSDEEKKITVQILDKMKRPDANPVSILENAFSQNWVKKIPPKIEPEEKRIPSKAKLYSKPKKEIILPTVVIKKSKIS